jgi:succinoglycan biosynthesis transport protein ExoP
MFKANITQLLARHWKYLFLFNVLVWSAVSFKLATDQTIWIAKSILIVPNNSNNLDANLGTLGSLRNGEIEFSRENNPLKIQKSILQSEILLYKLWQTDPHQQEISFESYKKLYDVSIPEESTTLNLSVNSVIPELAKQRLEAWIEIYQSRLNELRFNDGANRTTLSSQELERAEQNLRQSQLEVAQFQKSSGLVNSEQQTESMVTTINNLRTRLAEAQAQARANESKAKALSNRLGLTPDIALRVLSLEENPDYQFVRSKLTEVTTELTEARSVYSDQNPTVRALLAQQTNLQQQLQGYLNQAQVNSGFNPDISSGAEGQTDLIRQLIVAESEAVASRDEAEQFQIQLAQLNKLVDEIPDNQAQLQELQRKYEVAEGIYKGLVAQVQEVNLDAFSSYPYVEILDPPTVEEEPSSLKVSVLGGLLASVTGSLGLLLLLDKREPLLSPHDLQQLKFGFVISIPRFKTINQKLRLIPLLSGANGEDSSENQDIRPLFSHASKVEFQRLASAVSSQSLDSHRLLITSATEGEGKTTVVIGLGLALVDLGFRVLIVDGDFQKGELSKRFGCAQETTSLQQPKSLSTNLDVVPTLPQLNGMVQALTQGEFEQNLASIETQGNYDYVLVDSAPVNLASETGIMATIIQNVLFVVRPGISKTHPVRDSLSQLLLHQSQILGLVVNGVESQLNY